MLDLSPLSGEERKSDFRAVRSVDGPRPDILHSNSEKFVRNCWIVSQVMELGSSLRKFVKGLLLVCLVVTAVLTVLVASLSLWTWYKTAQVEIFYRENRLLGKMRAGQMDSTNESAPARKVLLEIVPLGTVREAAVATLRREGLGCQTIAEPVTDTRLRQRFLEARGSTIIPNEGLSRKDFVDCQAMTPNVLGYKQWIVDLEFDGDGHLSDAGVAIWNIFL
jgi:hypothetical protein